MKSTANPNPAETCSGGFTNFLRGGEKSKTQFLKILCEEPKHYSVNKPH